MADRGLLLWLLILAVGLGTYGMRLSFIAWLGRRPVPRRLAEALRLVPAAVLSALVVPAVLGGGGASVSGPAPERILAGIVAVVVARRGRGLFATIAAGMAAFWLARALLT
jgi:branched-subunit amino acid transport protein